VILARVGAAWGTGLVVAALFGDAWYWAVAGLFVVAAIAVQRGALSWSGGMALGVAAVAGSVLYINTIPSIGADSVARYAGAGTVVLTGTVVGEPEVRAADLRMRVRVEDVTAGGRTVPAGGDLLVISFRLFTYELGDRLELEGRVRLPSNPADFDYRGYLLRKGIVGEVLFPRIERVGSSDLPVHTRAIAWLRRAIADRLDAVLDVEPAALAQGVLVGRAPSLSPATKERLRATGLSHLVVVSGQNITLVGMLTASGLGWLIGRRKALLAGIVAAWCYAALAGFSPPVFRAVVMVTLTLFALRLGRPQSGFAALGLAFLILTVFDPQAIHDVSFQLSFAAMAGILLLSDRLLTLLMPPGERRLGFRGSAAEAVAVSFAAISGTLPVQLYHFEQVSLLAMPANLLVVPIFPLLVGAALLTVLLSLLSAELAGTSAVLLGVPFEWFGLVARSLGGLGAVSSSGVAGLLAATAVFGAVVGALTFGRRFGGLLARRGVAVPAFAGLAAVTAGVAVGLWSVVLTPGGGAARLDVLDIGAGQAVLVQSAEDHTVLIDGGEDGGRLLQQLNEALGPGSHRLDAVFVTSARSDHLAGLIDVVDRYEVGALVLPPGDASTFTERWLRRSFAAAGAKVVQAQPGQRLVMRGATVSVVATVAGPDGRGAAVLVEAGALPALLTGEVAPAEFGGLAAVQGGLLITPGRRLSQLLLDVVAPRALVVTGLEAPSVQVVERATWAAGTNGRLTFVASAVGVTLAKDR
jgi:competence protein ComEC